MSTDRVTSAHGVSRRVNEPRQAALWRPIILLKKLDGLAGAEFKDLLVGRDDWPTGLANPLEELVGRTPCRRHVRLLLNNGLA